MKDTFFKQSEPEVLRACCAVLQAARRAADARRTGKRTDSLID